MDINLKFGMQVAFMFYASMIIIQVPAFYYSDLWLGTSIISSNAEIMAYTVLARRYRSRNFDELVGQEAIATTLKNAIAAGRVAHAFLFTGTRGVGKTSSARILAKALNCEKGPTPTPSSTCAICQDIARGEDVDVIEIDGASNTSVEDVRQLRNNAIYRPARARFKIYIIDEVHMISTSAFNALLKTLEEPPEHVKFIFATTEPNKVPITIQSRCQRFDFKPISKSQIAEQIRHILSEEKIEADPAVVDRVARLANGSMRDALSLLDQILSVGQTKITPQLADQFLPVPPIEQYAELIRAALAHDAAGVLKQTDVILRSRAPRRVEHPRRAARRAAATTRRAARCARRRAHQRSPPTRGRTA
jgi:DNA polymerase-3 subunit gamma/tau